jgi:hypothetical protein
VNKAIERAAAVDPEWAKREQRNLWVVKGAAGGALLAIAIGVAAFVLGVNNHAEINHITQKVNSSCKIAEETNRRNKKATRECDQLRASIAENEPLRNSCIPYQRATGQKGHNCHGFYVPRNGSAVGGDASQPGPTGHQPPGPSGGHVGSGEGHQPTIVPPTPSQPEAPRSEPSTPSLSTPETPETVIESATPGVLAPTVEKLPEPVKPVVEEVCSAAAHLAHLC